MVKVAYDKTPTKINFSNEMNMGQYGLKNHDVVLKSFDKLVRLKDGDTWETNVSVDEVFPVGTVITITI